MDMLQNKQSESGKCRRSFYRKHGKKYSTRWGINAKKSEIFKKGKDFRFQSESPNNQKSCPQNCNYRDK